jgi:NadR type nicotinamide-nucleotide adenylyltransferase
MKRIGMTLGKFAPLHRGHELVIETMLAENDASVVVIYNTKKIQIPLPVRAQWIRKRFPSVTIIEAWDGPEEPDPSRLSASEFTNAWHDYEVAEEVFLRSLLTKHLGAAHIDAFYSSEYYGAHIAQSLSTPDHQCHDRRIDEARQKIPISATMIRSQPYEHRAYLNPDVYWDMLIKVVFVGAMSTGKSTITQRLADEYATTFAPEYGRYYWEKHQVERRIPLEAFNEIAWAHQQLELECSRNANRYLFVDTNAITTYMFSLDYHQTATAELTQLAIGNSSRYDLFFLCQDDIPYDDTWDRSGDGKRHIFQQQIIADLEQRKIPYIPLRGTLDERLSKVSGVLNAYQSYSNFYGKYYI